MKNRDNTGTLLEGGINTVYSGGEIMLSGVQSNRFLDKFLKRFPISPSPLIPSTSNTLRDCWQLGSMMTLVRQREVVTGDMCEVIYIN